MLKIYLAGFMSEKKLKETTEWRLRVRDYYIAKGWPIAFLDPWNGKEINNVTENGLKSNIPPKAIVTRDFDSVSESDLIVANLDTFGETRPPVGTLSEITWGWMMKKPVICITDNPNYFNHPFIKEFCCWIIPNIETLFSERIIDYFYKGVHGSIYTKEDINTMKKDEFK